MPLPCVEELEEERQSYNQAASQALVEVVKQGVEEDRVTCGIQQCVQLIASGPPEQVMLCLQVQLSATLDAAVKVPLLLLRAFCQENAIHLLHVLGENRMTQLLSACLSQTTKRWSDVTSTAAPGPGQEGGGGGGGAGGVECIMIKYPKHTISVEDDMVVGYIKQKMQSYTDPSVAIPDLTQAGVDMGFKLKQKKLKTPIQATSEPTASTATTAFAISSTTPPPPFPWNASVSQ